MPLVDRTVVIASASHPGRREQFLSTYETAGWEPVLGVPEVVEAGDDLVSGWEAFVQVLSEGASDRTLQIALLWEQVLLQPGSADWLELVLTGLPASTGGLWLHPGEYAVMMAGPLGTVRLVHPPANRLGCILRQELISELLPQVSQQAFAPEALMAHAMLTLPVYGCVPSLAQPAGPVPAGWREAFEDQRSKAWRWLRRRASS